MAPRSNAFASAGSQGHRGVISLTIKAYGRAMASAAPPIIRAIHTRLELADRPRALGWVQLAPFVFPLIGGCRPRGHGRDRQREERSQSQGKGCAAPLREALRSSSSIVSTDATAGERLAVQRSPGVRAWRASSLERALLSQIGYAGRHMSIARALSNDPLVQSFSKLSSCNVSDALDRLHVSGAPHRILPLWPGCPKIVGRASTLKLVDHGSQSPVQGTMHAIAAANPGDVMLVDHHGRMEVNSWGGIATFAALKRGLAGVVIDGVTRDVDEIRAMEFPTFAKGVIQQSIRNRCAFAGYGISVQLGHAVVRPGDLVL